MNYIVSIIDPVSHFIRLHWQINPIHQPTIRLQLPSWRPGRYELQNYAKNVRCFEIVDEKNKPVAFRKITKDCWEVDCSKAKSLTVTYEYYANQYDAGASYVDEGQLYINPVNCFMYVEGRMDEEYTIELQVPDSYKIACQLPVEGKTLVAKNFDWLADSPFIASDSLQHHSFPFHNSTFHFWFQGKHEIDIKQLEEHTKLYTQEQVAIFKELPCEEYHFLYHMLDKPFRHGVEHLDSTVITMGQGENETRDEFYNSFLAISSHELFHLWNVKRIRPEEMRPYDFTKENYSQLGYIYEGITTYYGDVMLLRSGVWSWEQYCDSFNGDLARHTGNPGRFNYSVAESSWDTWLDGYIPGIPGRKVSIYIEGMLAAFIADILIRKHSNGNYSLDHVMHDLYLNYKDGQGYDESFYQSLLEKYAGVSFHTYFKEVIHGKGQIEIWLKTALEHFGLQLAASLNETGTYRLQLSPTQNTEQEMLFKAWAAPS